jgi:hypothetical protein
MTTRTGQLTPIRRWHCELQQFTQGAGPGLMERNSQRALDGFQIGAAAVSPLGEDAAQQLIHFPRNFLMDCNSSFFS